MANQLRNIIVQATSEMLDDPGEHGIYKTTRFYDRLENEITEYIRTTKRPVSIYEELMLETVKNSQHLTASMQNVISQYLGYQSAPAMKVKGQLPPEKIRRRVL